MSRTDLCAVTRLSPSSVSAITSDLITEGALAEQPAAELPGGRRGRPQIALRLDPGLACVATLALTRNKLTAAIADYSGRITGESEMRLQTANCAGSEMIAHMTGLLASTLKASGSRAPSAIVAAVQGRTNDRGRDLLWSPIAAGRDVHLADMLEERFGVPAIVANDCSMIAAALRCYNPRRYDRDFMAVLLSHGIGMGLYLNNHLFAGTRSSAAEFGHMLFRPGGALCRCGARGCIEAYGGDYAIWRNAHGLPEDSLVDADLSPADMMALAARARQSDGPERAAYRLAAEAIGSGLASLFALIDPVPIAFVGSGTAAFDITEPHIRQAIAQSNAGFFADNFEWETFDSEFPLLKRGSVMTALYAVDDMVSAGHALPSGRIPAPEAEQYRAAS